MVWSPSVTAMLGFSSHPRDAGLRLMLERVLPADRECAALLFAEHRSTVGATSSRLVALSASAVTPIRALLALASIDASHGATHHGILVDVTPDLLRAGNAAVEAARDGNGAVQRAVGFLSSTYDLDPDVAITLLRRVSSHSNVKMRDLSELLVARARQRTRSGSRANMTLTQVVDDLHQHARSAQLVEDRENGSLAETPGRFSAPGAL